MAATPQGWLESYEDARAQLTVTRLRWAGGVIGLGLLVLVVQMLSAGTSDVGWRMLLALPYAVAGVLGGLATIPRPWRRSPERIAVGVMLGLVANMALSFPYTPDELHIAPSAFVAAIMGSALYFPLGACAQAAVALLGVAAYAWVLDHTAGAPLLSAMGLVVAAAFASVVSTELIERHRRASFVRAWQQERLVAFARVLAEHPTRDQVVAHLTAWVGEVLDAPWIVVALYDERHDVFRIATSMDEGVPQPKIVGVESPTSSAGVSLILDRGVIALPADDPSNPILPLLASKGVRGALFATLRDASGVLGIVNVGRRSTPDFTADERRLLEALGRQAASALRTIGLVSDLRAADRAKSDWVATISHELRTPVGVVLGMTEMLLDGSLDADQRDQVERIRQSADHLTTLVRDVLDFSKIESATLTLQAAPFDVRQVVTDVYAMLQPAAQDKGLVLETDVDAAAGGLVVGDADRLRQVVLNLVGNAIKFTHEGRVRVQASVTSRTSDRVAYRIAVEDTGVGIAADAQASIFEAFRQAEPTTGHQFGGTGLGLAISRRLIGLMGGTLTVSSAPGVGSTFVVVVAFPRVGAGAGEAAA